MVARIIIVGSGHTGDSLVDRLATLAPVTVVDTSARALNERSIPPAPEGPETPFRHQVTSLQADGSSRLVLQDLRGDGADPMGLVAATGSDRVNLEICRLALALDYRPIVGIAIAAAAAPDYEALGVRPIVRADVLGQSVQSAFQYEGRTIATMVGLGRGDIVEVTVLPSSPVIGVPLAELDAVGWRVAAIYRGGALVLPTGSSAIVAEDRVLLVGEPRILLPVAEHIRTGVPSFPVGFGPYVVVYLPAGRDRALEQPAELLTIRTRAAGLMRLSPAAAASRLLVEEGERQERKTFSDAPLEGTTVTAHVRALNATRPGLVVARAHRRRLPQRLLGAGGPEATLCNGVPAPVLFVAGSLPFGRVVLFLAAATDLATVDVAIDLARLLEVPFVILHTALPRFLDGDADRIAEVEQMALRRAALYGIPAQTERHEGNPIRTTARRVAPTDLLVVARRRALRDAFTAPDVALRLARRAVCSTLVVTVARA